MTPATSRTRSAHSKFQVPTELHIYRLLQVQLLPRTIPLWNRLPTTVVEAASFCILQEGAVRCNLLKGIQGTSVELCWRARLPRYPLADILGPSPRESGLVTHLDGRKVAGSKHSVTSLSLSLSLSLCSPTVLVILSFLLSLFVFFCAPLFRIVKSDS